MTNIDRRSFVKTAITAVAGAASLTSRSHAAESRAVRIGVIGLGRRGSNLVKTLLAIPGVELPALCDVSAAALARSVSAVEAAQAKRPEGYGRDERDYLRMLERDDLDAVIAATPWEWHVPMMVATMKAGKYAATEVPAATTIEGCWELVRTSESTGVPCMMLENVCYYRQVMALLNMVRSGMFGEILHCEGGYLHDLRKTLLATLAWRLRHYAARNGNLYPTHPLGPIAHWTNLNRGDRVTHLVSMSSNARGLNRFAAARYGADDARARQVYAAGDVNTTLLRTAGGVTITLSHDTTSPRPYSFEFKLQGTAGLYNDDRIYLEGKSAKHNQWESFAPYLQRFEHPLWKTHMERALSHGHGGSDYVLLHSFVEAVRHKTQTPIDVYDSATWSAVGPLTEQSLARGSMPVEMPDFTGGKWKTSKPTFGLVS